MRIYDIIPVAGWSVEDIKYVCESVKAQRVVLLEYGWKEFNK